MAKKTWIEVALNGEWTRRLQPHIPVTPQEIISEPATATDIRASLAAYKMPTASAA